MQESTNFDLSVQVPQGFSAEKLPWGYVVFDQREKSYLQSAGLFDSAKVGQWGSSATQEGRHPLRRIPLGSGSALIREFQHGGLFRGLTGRRYSNPSRPFEELSLATQILQASIQTPWPVAALAAKTSGGYRLFLMTREIQGQDLLEYLKREKDFESRKAVLRKAGQMIRRMHDWGLWHADLHLKNLFLETHSQSVFVLDLDRGQKMQPLPTPKKAENLVRLYRYAEKRKAKFDEKIWTPEEAQELFEGYHAGKGSEIFQEVVRGFEASAWLHRLAWKLG